MMASLNKTKEHRTKEEIVYNQIKADYFVVAQG